MIDGRKVLPIKARTAPGFGERVLAPRVPILRFRVFFWLGLLASSSTVSRRSIPGSGFGGHVHKPACGHESEYFGGTLVNMLGVNLRYEIVRAIFSISRAQQCANLGMAGTACAIFL